MKSVLALLESASMRWLAASAFCALVAACGGGDSDESTRTLPHTGITRSQCYERHSDTLLSCSATAVIDFNAQQDGHRFDVNPMSYSRVGDQPLTHCVKDDVTGLIWEGKEAAGSARAGDKLYTNLDNGLATDASGHLRAVNAASLCGFSDWRMPAASELLGLVDASRTTGLIFREDWFVNSVGIAGSDRNFYWAREDVGTPGNAYGVSFDRQIWAGEVRRGQPIAVRLVRGAPPAGTRFTYGTVVYTGDAENNVVNDTWTGLQWRRCEQGKEWNGSACTGASYLLTHEQALAEARTRPGWRMPNIKELDSIVDRSVATGAKINPTAFPRPSQFVWASTPDASAPNRAQGALFTQGAIYSERRDANWAVRLVRIGS